MWTVSVKAAQSELNTTRMHERTHHHVTFLNLYRYIHIYIVLYERYYVNETLTCYRFIYNNGIVELIFHVDIKFGMLSLLEISQHTQLLLSDVRTIHQSCFSFILKIICQVLIKIWSYKNNSLCFLAGNPICIGNRDT